MATVNASNIFVGAPDQASSGAVFSAAVGSTAPTDAITALAGAFTSSGYVTVDGVSLSADRTVTGIRDWSGKTVRTVSDETSATVSFNLLELSSDGAKQAFGASKVTVTAANSTHGAQLAITADGEMPEPKAWAFNMKDGIRKVRLYIPVGQVTDLPDMTFTAGDAINIPVTITCYPDSNGVLYQVFTDDGITTP